MMHVEGSNILHILSISFEFFSLKQSRIRGTCFSAYTANSGLYTPLSFSISFLTAVTILVYSSGEISLKRAKRVKTYRSALSFGMPCSSATVWDNFSELFSKPASVCMGASACTRAYGFPSLTLPTVTTFLPLTRADWPP